MEWSKLAVGSDFPQSLDPRWIGHTGPAEESPEWRNLRVPTVYCRNLVVRHLDETVPGSHIHAVVQDLREDRLGYLVQGVPGNAGPFQNRLDCTGSHRVSLAVDLEQQAGVLHRVGNNLARPSWS